jgi:hypothetical protein
MSYSTGKHIQKLEKAPSRFTVTIVKIEAYLFMALISFYYKRLIAANVRRLGEGFKSMGIDLQYPMYDLPMQCKNLESSWGEPLLKSIDRMLNEQMPPIKEPLLRMETAARRCRHILPSVYSKITELIAEIEDDIISPLKDVREVLNSLYGSDRIKIEKLNKKISGILSA